MKRVLIDTNVAIDFYLKLPGFFVAADRIFQAIRSRKIVAYISASVVTDLYYVVRLMYSRQDQWREDALLIMFGNKPWSFDRPLYLRSKLMKRIASLAKELPGQRRTQMRLLNRGSPSR
jgi:predicted nucleic acid-binding protein